MDRRRRTVPRSARRGQQNIQSPQAPFQEGSQGTVRKSNWDHSYVPEFDSSQAPANAGAAEALPPIRTGVEAISPQCCKPHVSYAAAPLTCVRWLPTMSMDAVAVVGSGDGGPEMDWLYFYEVFMERDAVVSRQPTEISHPGKVNDIAVSRTSGMVYYGSSDGGVRCMQADAWKNDDVQIDPVVRLPKRGLKHEAVMGVAPLENNSCFAFGSSGSLVAADVATGVPIFTVNQADAVGFRDADAIDPDGGFQAVAAGSSGDVTVWDVRAGKDLRACTDTLKHSGRGVLPLCVTVDATQPNFVIAGTASGELSIWDRRGGDGFPISRVAVHDGFVWDVKVVASRPGLLLSCGEDASVWLMDYGNAAKRAPMGTAVDGWCESGEYWRAQLTQSDLRDVAAGTRMLGINSVCAHPQADLYAYTSDSAAVTFGSLYN